MKKIAAHILAVCALTLCLGSCGIKPSSVKPPENSTTIYPALYPYPQTNSDQGPALDAPVVKAPKTTTKTTTTTIIPE